MRALVVFCVVLMLTVPVLASAGQNEASSLEGTALVSVQTADASVANEEFSIIVELSDEASSNGTVVGWTTQICINSGVCYAPQTSDLSSDSEGRIWTGDVLVDDEASYVNWRIELDWADGNESSVPETGFGWKVWSTCWYDTDSDQWGGSNVGDEGCEAEENTFIPGFAVTLALTSVTMAGLMAKRD